MPRGRGKAKSAKGKRGRGSAKKGSVKSRAGLRIFDFGKPAYRGNERPHTEYKHGRYLHQKSTPKVSRSLGRAKMPNYGSKYMPLRRGQALMNRRAFNYANNNKAKFNNMLNPQPRGMPRQITRSKVRSPKNVVKESNNAYANSKSVTRGTKGKYTLAQRLAALQGEGKELNFSNKSSGVNNKAITNKKGKSAARNAFMSRFHAAGKKTRGRSKGKGRKGSKRRV